MRITNYSELFNQIEEDIKTKLPDKTRGIIQEFVGYRHVELKDRERKDKSKSRKNLMGYKGTTNGNKDG